MILNSPFWRQESDSRTSLIGQSSTIGLFLPSATLWCSWRSVRRLSDCDLTWERIFCNANFALRVRAENRIRCHTEWNRKSFKMNFQWIQLNLSPIFSESNRDNAKQKMSFFAEKKNEKYHLCKMKNWSCMTREGNYNILGCFYPVTNVQWTHGISFCKLLIKIYKKNVCLSKDFSNPYRDF